MEEEAGAATKTKTSQTDLRHKGLKLAKAKEGLRKEACGTHGNNRITIKHMNQIKITLVSPKLERDQVGLLVVATSMDIRISRPQNTILFNNQMINQ